MAAIAVDQTMTTEEIVEAADEFRWGSDFVAIMAVLAIHYKGAQDPFNGATNLNFELDAPMFLQRWRQVKFIPGQARGTTYAMQILKNYTVVGPFMTVERRPGGNGGRLTHFHVLTRNGLRMAFHLFEQRFRFGFFRVEPLCGTSIHVFWTEHRDNMNFIDLTEEDAEADNNIDIGEVLDQTGSDHESVAVALDMNMCDVLNMAESDDEY